MSEFKSFICDDKFDTVIKEMESRGWKRNPTQGMIPAHCDLIWRNLASTNFMSVFRRRVNHFRGSNHLSNKAFLTYHLRATGNAALLPPTWSASFETLHDLVMLLSTGTLMQMLTLWHEMGSIPREATSELSTLRDILQALDMETAPESSSHCSMGALHALLTLCELLSQNPAAVSSAGSLRQCVEVWAREAGQAEDLRDIIGDDSFVGTRNLWIIKPVGGSCGEHIEVVSGLKGALACVRRMAHKCVVQKYLERPLLVRGGRKFDIRQWVLVTDVNPLEIYGFSEFYLRLSHTSLDLSDDKLSDAAVHLCNHAVQKTAIVEAEAAETSTSSSPLSHTMMSKDEFTTWLMEHFGESQGREAVDRLLEQIRGTAVSAVKCAVDRLVRVGQGFEWLGLDLMVCDPTGRAEDLRVKLIEVNVSPDVSLSTPITQRLVTAGTRSLLDIVLDEVNDVDRQDPATCAWQGWYHGDTEAKGWEKRATAAKDAKVNFGKGYGPRLTHVLDRVEALLGVQSVSGSGSGVSSMSDALESNDFKSKDNSDTQHLDAVAQKEDSDSDDEI